MQALPLPQMLPQAPQLLLSVAGSTHAPPQGISPTRQTIMPPHLPWAHACPLGHTTPHAPQLFGSLASTTHIPLHMTCPRPGHGPPPPLHTPFTQATPLPQALPQAPQLEAFVNKSTQM